MNDKEKILEEVQKTLNEQCQRLKGYIDDIVKGTMGMVYAALMHLDEGNYDNAREQLINTIITLENQQERIEQ